MDFLDKLSKNSFLGNFFKNKEDEKINYDVFIIHLTNNKKNS